VVSTVTSADDNIKLNQTPNKLPTDKHGKKAVPTEWKQYN